MRNHHPRSQSILMINKSKHVKNEILSLFISTATLILVEIQLSLIFGLSWIGAANMKSLIHANITI